TTLEIGDRVLVSCITSCGRCRFCKERRYGLCTGGGGWIFGHLINGLQAEYARIPFADTSTYKVPEGLSDEQVLFLADILPTAYEVGVLNSRVEPGDTVAIVGAGPIGLAAILTAKLYTPAHIVAIDLDDGRLERAREFGADVTINNGSEAAVTLVQQLTDGLGADVAIEAVGVAEAFELCTEPVRPGGRVANVGGHRHSATLPLVGLRPPTAADADALVAFFEHLSERSRYLRFHGVRAVGRPLVEDDLEPDWVERGALLGTLAGDEGGERVVALASWVRLRDPQAAEIGFAVADDEQGRGIGTRLLEQ